MYKIWKRPDLLKTPDSVAFKALIITLRNCLSQWSSTFFVQSPPTGILFKNRLPLMILFLSRTLFYFENNSMVMKYKRAIL